MIEYQTTLEGISADHLNGFFVRWKHPLSTEQHFHILENSSYFVLAYDTDAAKVVGFVNALSDEVNFAFIPMIEVLPSHQRKRVGTEMMKRMLQLLHHIPCIDLTCDPKLQSFYKRFGMVESYGMVIRKYLRAQQ